MTKLSTLSAALLGISVTTASAGSFPPVEAVMESPMAVSWAGAYAGGIVGYEFGNIAVDDQSGVAGGNFQVVDIPVDGLAGGVLAGYNWQRGNMVFGVEADYAFGGATGSSLVDIVNEDETLEWQTNWSSTIRGRVGVAKNDWLFYGTAGVAFADANVGYLNMDDSGTIVEGDDRQDQAFNGWSVGAGVEKMIGDHLVVRGEYLYSQYGEVAFPFAPGFGDVGYTPSISTVRAAVIWSF